MNSIALVAINSKYIHSNLAVYSLKAFYEEQYAKKDVVEILEFTINQQIDAILRGIYERKPRIVAFSCYIWNISYVYQVAEALKKILPETKIWVGGPEVTYHSEKVLCEHPAIDLVMVGEGEATFGELVELYQTTEEPSEEQIAQVKGLTLRRGYTGPRELLDLDQVPFVYRDLKQFENRIIYYESSRGCPFRCSYCLSSVDKRLRFRSLPKVYEELRFFLDHQVKQVKFVDRTFNCDKQRTVELLQFILDNDNGVTNFHFEIAADLISNAELEIMKQMRPGLIQLEIGVQSTNPETIREIDRVMDLNQVKDIVAKVKSFGNIHQHLDLIAGLPYENLERFKESFNDIYHMEPNQLQLGFLKVLKGTKMEEKKEEYGILYQDKEPFEVLSTKWLSYGDILELKRIEDMVEVYYNSGQYPNTMKLAEKLFDTPYELFSYLATFYEERHLFEKSHTKISRYEYLFESLTKRLDVLQTKYEQSFLAEVLLYDLCLRENLKSRPSFAPIKEEYKQQVKDLLRDRKAKETGYLRIEPFKTEVLNFVGIEHPNPNSEVAYVLFDYEHRDPLDNNAKTILL